MSTSTLRDGSTSTATAVDQIHSGLGPPQMCCAPSWTWPTKSSSPSRPSSLPIRPPGPSPKSFEPRGLRVHRGDQQLGPARRDLRSQPDQKDFVKANGWPLANTVIRHYRSCARASADGQVVTSTRSTGWRCKPKTSTVRPRTQRRNGALMARDSAPASPTSPHPWATNHRWTAALRSDGIRGHAIVLSDLTANPAIRAKRRGPRGSGIDRRHPTPARAGGHQRRPQTVSRDQISARYVVISGCRRLAAAPKVRSRSDLAVVINDGSPATESPSSQRASPKTSTAGTSTSSKKARAVETLVAGADAPTKPLRGYRTAAWVSGDAPY